MTKNFRKAYYSSLGVQVVEVKPSLENALQGDVLDLERLNKLCLWVRIPHFYRQIVWKLLLGVVPLEKETWTFVDEQRVAQFEALKAAALVVHRTRGPSTADLTANTMCQMLAIHLDAGWADPAHMSEALENMLPVAQVLLEICDTSEVDAYWIFEFFVRTYNPGVEVVSRGREQIRIHIETASLKTLLKAHSPTLAAHVQTLRVDLDVACGSWFRTCFANVLPSHSLEGIWDILIGGAPLILTYLGLSLLLASRRKLEGARTAADFLSVIANIGRFVDVDAVASTAIDLWEKPVLDSMTKETRRLLGYA
ncbi:hypothetical protein BDK51DRAFT_28016 [Blyttiomyces helicus]|uniref:TBC1 domain family member 7 n=1 Tax=Blyttiomyces helicus TaxID=388810 RepID=A0A4P9WRV7_9FUNG|nr:hypothetical protein BDK51DRAFT_28016 [Blyttiomyces helicus]|eukprot:RKO93676.1 hypothetical protein BDK51DRAFT_28016 [Blyttiomyces helicus]